MNMKKLREKAIKRYLNGESLKELCQSLGKGKTWFFKWLKRYKLDAQDWINEYSRGIDYSLNLVPFIEKLYAIAKDRLI